jgi:predicted ATPase
MLEVTSVVGAEFSAAAVAAGMETEVDGIEEQCEALVRREHFLRASGTAEWPDGTVAARYGFLHALYQDVLYHRLTARRRQRLHQQIGEREEQAYGERAREIAAELALHFERGRDYHRAVRYLQQAGENAVRRSAYHEAVALLVKGLELIQTLPDTPERAQRELMLQIALGPPLKGTKGFGAPEAEAVYARARELCRQLGDTPQLFSVLRGLRQVYLARAEHETARELSEQLLTLAQRLQDPGLLVEAHIALGNAALQRGELGPAREHGEQGIALYDPEKHSSYTSRGEYDPGVDCRCLAMSALWLLGYPDQALKRSQEALSFAQEVDHPLSLGLALANAVTLHQFRREAQATREQAEALLALSTERGFLFWIAGGTIMRGWVLAEQGQGEEGITLMHHGMVAFRDTGAEVFRPYFLALLAEACGKTGQAEEGLTVLAEALATAHKTVERWYEAELYRLRGELTLAQSSVQSLASGVQENQKPALSLVEGAKGKSRKQLSIVSSQLSVTDPRSLNPDPQFEAEVCFLKAIEIAQKQQAKSLELRATMSLSRLWQQQGKVKQAHKVLSEIYGWFTEGFDTKNLQEAKALLGELQR